MIQRISDFCKKKRLFWGGVALALALVLVLGWVGYNLHTDTQSLSRYQILHDDYTEKQGLAPIDPAIGLYQTLQVETATPLYGMRLMFATFDRVPHGTLTATLLQNDETLATAALDMTKILDGAFVDVVFDAPVQLQKDTAYLLVLSWLPETAEDQMLLVCGEGAQAQEALPLTDPLSSEFVQRTAVMQLMTNHTGTRYGLKLFLPVAVLLFVTLMLGYWLVFVRNVKMHVSFAVLAAGLGLVFCLVVPPLSAPDEYVHVANSYQFASEILGQTAKEDRLLYIGELPMRACDAPFMRQNSGEIGIFAYKEMTDNLLTTGNEGALTETAKVRAGEGHLLQYIPQTLGVLLARVLGLSFFAMLLLGRVANLACYVALGTLALRTIPVGKRLLFSVMLLPMCLQLAASFSRDNLVLGVAFCFIALCLQGAYGEAPLCIKGKLALVVTGLFLAPSKAIYILLLALCLIIPNKKLGGNVAGYGIKIILLMGGVTLWINENAAVALRSIKLGSSLGVSSILLVAFFLLGSAVLAGLAWLWETCKQNERRRKTFLWVGGGVVALAVAVVLWKIATLKWLVQPEVYQQEIYPNGDSYYMFTLAYCVNHLQQTVKLLVASLTKQFPSLLQGLVGTLPGEPIVYGIQLSWTLTMALLAQLMLSATRPIGATNRLKKGHGLLFGGIVLGVFALLLVVCLGWTPSNYTQMFGLQGRYLLPVLPVGLLVGETSLVQLRTSARKGLALSASLLGGWAALETLLAFALA